MDNFDTLKQLLTCYAKHEMYKRYQLLDGTIIDLSNDMIGVSRDRVKWSYYPRKNCLLNYFTVYAEIEKHVLIPIFTI